MPARSERDNPPTLDEYFASAIRLAALVRESLDKTRVVKRGEIRRALEAFERFDKKASRPN